MPLSSALPVKNFGKSSINLDLPYLLEVQHESWGIFWRQQLQELLQEISPIRDYTKKEFELWFLDYKLGEPNYATEMEAKRNDDSFEAPLRVKTRLVNLKSKEAKEQEVYLCDFPLMTERGTFVLNGVERVAISQLIRSPGAFFTAQAPQGRKIFGAKIIPNRGAWLEFETESSGFIAVRIDRKRKAAATTLLRAFGVESDEQIRELFRDVDTGDVSFIEETLRKDTSKNQGEELVEVLKEVIRLNNKPGAEPDQIDHLGNRRVRTFVEFLQNRMRIGFMRMERIVKDRMTTLDPSTITPGQLINPRPVMAVVKEFFTSSQITQFMDNENPLAELEHKRRVSATGPGGLTRERAGFEVRDVQPSHYGRICPIQTPEGPNIGLVGHLATYARINDHGFIETPYYKVKGGKVSKDIEYLSAYEEEQHVIAHAGVEVSPAGDIASLRVESRVQGEPGLADRAQVDFIDVGPEQSISVATSLIPFLRNDDANRALMGSNMQRQAVPLIRAQAPLVGTGLEERVAKDSGLAVVAQEAGEVTFVDATRIRVESKAAAGSRRKEQEYSLRIFQRTNQYTCFHQRPIVSKGDQVKAGQVIADGGAIDNGRFALGTNLLVAFMPWRGYNYEDAIIISQKLVKEDAYTSIHIEDFSCQV